MHRSRSFRTRLLTTSLSSGLSRRALQYLSLALATAGVAQPAEALALEFDGLVTGFARWGEDQEGAKKSRKQRRSRKRRRGQWRGPKQGAGRRGREGSSKRGASQGSGQKASGGSSRYNGSDPLGGFVGVDEKLFEGLFEGEFPGVWLGRTPWFDHLDRRFFDRKEVPRACADYQVRNGCWGTNETHWLYERSVRQGRRFVLDRWKEKTDCSQLEAFVDSINAEVKERRPRRRRPRKMCRYGGFSDGVMEALEGVRERCALSCAEDGRLAGKVSAGVYCSLSQLAKGLERASDFVRGPVKVCGENFQNACDASFVAEAKVYKNDEGTCEGYTQGKYAEIFDRYRNDLCIYEIKENKKPDNSGASGKESTPAEGGAQTSSTGQAAEGESGPTSDASGSTTGAVGSEDQSSDASGTEPGSEQGTDGTGSAQGGSEESSEAVPSEEPVAETTSGGDQQGSATEQAGTDETTDETTEAAPVEAPTGEAVAEETTTQAAPVEAPTQETTSEEAPVDATTGKAGSEDATEPVPVKEPVDGTTSEEDSTATPAPSDAEPVAGGTGTDEEPEAAQEEDVVEVAPAPVGGLFGLAALGLGLVGLGRRRR